MFVFNNSISRSGRRMRLVYVALGMLAFYWALSPSAFAAPWDSESGTASIRLSAGTGRTVRLPGAAASLFSADQKVAEVRPASPDSFFVFGVAPGNTTIEAVSEDGQLLGQYEVHVAPAGYAGSVLSESDTAGSPGVRIAPVPNGLSLTGRVADPQSAQKLLNHARSLVGKGGYVGDYMTVPGTLQVNLRVRVVEMQRSLVHELGVEWQTVNRIGTKTTIGVVTHNPLAAAISDTANTITTTSAHKNWSLETVVDALAEDGLVHSLAEPNLTTMSGQPASFLVGGEYPIPTSSYGGTTNVQFKQYGISLGFVPTVLKDGKINIHVRPEVSALSSDGAVTLTNGNSSVQIPAITARRADTTVELSSGQSFVIAGLLSDTTQINSSGLPWLGDIPVLGALFKSSSFQKKESELVIIVTPYLVNPVNNVKDLHTPDEGWVPPSDLERVFLSRQSSSDTRKKRGRQRINTGDAGFMVE